MLSSSLPQYTGEIKSSKIINDIEIYRDSFAVPYIIAESDEDVAFALRISARSGKNVYNGSDSQSR